MYDPTLLLTQQKDFAMKKFAWAFWTFWIIAVFVFLGGIIYNFSVI